MLIPIQSRIATTPNRPLLVFYFLQLVKERCPSAIRLQTLTQRLLVRLPPAQIGSYGIVSNEYPVLIPLSNCMSNLSILYLDTFILILLYVENIGVEPMTS